MKKSRRKVRTPDRLRSRTGKKRGAGIQRGASVSVSRQLTLVPWAKLVNNGEVSKGAAKRVLREAIAFHQAGDPGNQKLVALLHSVLQQL
jgi:hypothetical protein